MTEVDLDCFEELRKRNPHLEFCHPSDLRQLGLGESHEFVAPQSWLTYLESAVRMPESGTVYVPSVSEMEGTEEFRSVARRCYGEMPLQFGYCMGFNSRLNALEWHKGSELVVAATDLVLLLDSVSRIDFTSGHYTPKELKALFLKAGTVVELYAGTLHFAPLQILSTGFRAGIILPRETNFPLSAPPSDAVPYLWARNKWLMAHPESPQAGRGARVGIQGVNICLNGIN